MTTSPRPPMRLFVEECSNGYILRVYAGPFLTKEMIADTPEAVLRLVSKVMLEPITQEGA